ncbi:type VI secretion system membrane subunit TssM, partial [Caballeronia sp. BR00000012568055]|uniref:type VI secretion system membrane subunit TssM n=1 Tax=Caballeronia sp. BR00000012568055 TaxID=2918761 RepID=UPI0023F62663
MKKKWFSGYRWILPLLALVAVSLIIWFLGPYFTFGGLKPLEGIGMRVLLIALALGATLLWLKAWSMSPMFVALLCLLIWHAAPLLGFGEFRPFAPESVRIAAVVIVLALFALYWLIWLLHRMRTDKDFLDKALKFGSKAEPSPAAERLRIVESRANVALTRLRRMRTNAKSIGRIFKGANYLYELPWYICLGATSAGKTHAVLQSGLQFESDGADRHGNESAATEYAHWRLSNDAVFIDTAGHYTHHGQSSGQVPARPANTDVPIADADWRRTIDAEEWHGFIALLRRRRPRVPVNGALLTVKLDVLTSPNASVRSREAAALRARLLDMRNMFGIRFPVYLIVAQMDRLPGFTDYFASLTNEHRAQVWGFTLPLDSTDLGAQCTGEFLRLSKRLSDGLNSRLDDEDAAMRRQRLAVLPEAFDALQGPLVELLLQLFPDSRYDDTQAHGNLRAVFFTSALQAGQEVVSEPLTIVQRLAAGLSLSVNRVGARAESAHGFFLHDAFKKVILPEAHLVRPNLRWEYRSRVMRIIGHTLALLMLAWLAVSLHVSFSNNRDYLSAIGQKTDALAARVMQFYKAPKTEALPD